MAMDETASLMSERPQTLYHAMTVEPVGDVLFSSVVRTINGKTAPFLFASGHLSKSLAFGFSYPEKEIMMNGPIEGTNDEFVVICGGQKTLEQPRHVRVFSFESAGFVAVEGKPRQYVSEAPVPLAKAQRFMEITDVEDIMRLGVQIFMSDKSFEELWSEGFVDKVKPYSGRIPEFLAMLVQKEGLKWINRDRHVNPNPLLVAALGKAKTPKAEPAKFGL